MSLITPNLKAITEKWGWAANGILSDAYPGEIERVAQARMVRSVVGRLGGKIDRLNSNLFGCLVGGFEKPQIEMRTLAEWSATRNIRTHRNEFRAVHT